MLNRAKRNARRISGYQRRKLRQDRIGIGIMAASLLGFAGFIAAAVQIDAARGMTVSESLASAGIGRAAPLEAPAVPVRLIGDCGGRIMAADSESAFPAGCAWIVPAGRPFAFATLAEAEEAAGASESCVGIARRPDGWTLESCEEEESL